MFVYSWKCIRLTEISAEPKIRLYFRPFSQYMNTEESLSIKGWTVFLYLYAPKCIEFCHISYRWKIAKIFHRWSPWDSAIPAVLHIFPNKKVSKTILPYIPCKDMEKILARILHSNTACILHLKNILPYISNFCGFGRLDRLKYIFSEILQPKNRVFIQKYTEWRRYFPESSDFI